MIALGAFVAWYIIDSSQYIYTDNPPGWQPDRALVRSLAKEIDLPPFQQFHIRPPKGGALLSQANGTGRIITIGSPLRSDQTRSALYIYVSPPLPPGADLSSLDKMFRATLKSWKMSPNGETTDWDNARFEEGTLSGVKFLRTAVQGKSERINKKTNGFAYFGADGSNVVFFFSEDLESYPGDLRLLEASVLTFRRR